MTQLNPRPAKLQELEPPKKDGAAVFPPHLELIQGVKVRLGATVGHAEITVAELFALKEGALLQLDRLTDEPLQVHLDGKLVAEGELVVVDDHFGLRLTRIGDQGLG